MALLCLFNSFPTIFVVKPLAVAIYLIPVQNVSDLEDFLIGDEINYYILVVYEKVDGWKKHVWCDR